MKSTNNRRLILYRVDDTDEESSTFNGAKTEAKFVDLVSFPHDWLLNPWRTFDAFTHVSVNTNSWRSVVNQWNRCFV